MTCETEGCNNEVDYIVGIGKVKLCSECSSKLQFSEQEYVTNKKCEYCDNRKDGVSHKQSLFFCCKKCLDSYDFKKC